MSRILLRGALLTTLFTLALTSPSHAHFNLKAPPNWLVQDEDGNPQKMGPCGSASEAQPAAQMSNIVTEFKAGAMVTITLEETVPHPGHYRVALVDDRSKLPADPAVTTGQTACGSTVIMDPPVLPILADGMLTHTSAFPMGQDQTIMVQLPADMECEKCTLQVIEFMSSHAAPCFYHHCADLKITKDGSGSGGMGGMSAGGASSGGMSAGGASSGGMSAGGASSGGMSAGGASSAGTAGQSGSGGAGAGGMSSAGTSGAGVAPTAGMGGTTTGMGGTTTATGGTGNTMTGAGGSTAGHAGTGTPVAPTTASNPPEEEGGCNTAPGRESSPLALLALLGLAALRTRRRR